MGANSVTWVSIGTEGAAEILQRKLDASPGDVAQAALHLASSWLSDERMRVAKDPVLLATKERLLRVGPDGEVFEPIDGVTGIGASASFVSGAAKALVVHTTLDAEAIVNATLQLLADTWTITSSALNVHTVA